MVVWPAVVLSVLIAFGIALFAVGLLGWRRPGAAENERLWMSGVYFFLLLFFAVWASSAWLEPWGPVLADVAWLNLLAVGVFIGLIVFAASPPARRARLRRGRGGLVATERAPMEDSPAETVPAALAGGFGVTFWLVLLLLIAAALAGAIL